MLREKWAANLAELCRAGVPFDLVVFTGDLGDWGHPTDDPRACELLKQTCAALGVPLDQLFVIPGNHDVDRTIQRAALESLRRDVAKDPRAYSTWMAGEDRGTLRGDGHRDQILERQQVFWGPMATELGQPALGPWHSPHRRLGYRQAVTHPGLSQPIQVIGLDTAWLAGDEQDDGELPLTEHQVMLLTTTEGGEPLPGLPARADAPPARGSGGRDRRSQADDRSRRRAAPWPPARAGRRGAAGPDHQLLVLATGCLYEGDEEHRYANTCQAASTEYQPPLSAETIAAAIDRADGNVLYAVMLHDALRGLPVAERRLDRIPRGLKGLIGEIWDRAASHKSVRVGLGLLCAAQEALSLDVIAELAGWGPDDYEERERFVREARQLLLEEPESWAGAEAYRPRHDWVRELMAERLGGATVRAHHATLSHKLATWPALVDATARQYALRHALVHRVEAGAWADAWRLAADMSFLEAKCRELGAHEAEADVAHAAECCRASGDEALRGRFDDLARALGRESHWLRTAPEAVAALVWNRLRLSGWSTGDLDQQLRGAAEASFLRVRHVATRESPALVRDLVGHSGSVLGCAVAADGRRVVSASEDHTLKIWDLATGRALATLEGHAARVRGCAVTPDGLRVVSASTDKTLKVWDLATGRALATLVGHAARVNGCAVTPDGLRVVSASSDKTLKVWDLASGRAETTLEGHAGSVTACAVTPDGRWVVSASGDQTLKVWDLASGRAEATLEGHADSVSACAVTPDGRRLVSASGDQTLKVWDLQAGACLVTHRANAGYVAIATTATAIIAGDAAGAVWFLDLPPSYHSAVLTSDTQAPAVTEGMELPIMTNPELPEGTDVPASVVFVVIQRLKDCSDAPKVPSALRALNQALRAVPPGAYVLSTIAGAIVVVPDTEHWGVDDMLHALDEAKVGFTLRVGVTHGTVEVVRDIDNESNLIGPPINIAARLATSPDNPGSLFHESYVRFVDSDLPATHWLHRTARKPRSITGKAQDPVFSCFEGPHAFEAKPLEREEQAPPRLAVLVAYDLPKFSAGDRAQLRQRFTRLAHVFQKLRQSAAVQRAAALLSPGGDGGVLVLEGVTLHDATALAERLRSLTQTESLGHDKTVAVDIRIGVHYGRVVHYLNARGVERPTGLALFVADEIAGDDHARSRHGIILTHDLADSLVEGSSVRLAAEFEQLPPPASGPARGVERFVKRDPAPARPMEARGATPPPQTSMTSDDLLTRLKGVLASEFDEVLHRAKVPVAHIPGDSAPQATRAIQVIRYFEQRNQLAQLVRILDEVTASPR